MVANPYIKHKERLLELFRLTRYSLQYSVVDLALHLNQPVAHDCELNEMIAFSTNDDLTIAFELMQWNKLAPGDAETKAICQAIMDSNDKAVTIHSVTELFKHYQKLSIPIGETSRAAAEKVQGLLDKGAVLRPFSGLNDDLEGVFGHEVVMDGNVFREHFAVNPSNGNHHLSYGNTQAKYEDVKH